MRSWYWLHHSKEKFVLALLLSGEKRHFMAANFQPETKEKDSIGFKGPRVILEEPAIVITSLVIDTATFAATKVGYATADTSAALHGSIPLGAVSMVAVFHFAFVHRFLPCLSLAVAPLQIVCRLLLDGSRYLGRRPLCFRTVVESLLCPLSYQNLVVAG